MLIGIGNGYVFVAEMVGSRMKRAMMHITFYDDRASQGVLRATVPAEEAITYSESDAMRALDWVELPGRRNEN